MCRGVLMFVFMLTAAATATAATRTWTGNVSTSWTNSSNWSGGVPGSSDDVVIPGSRPRYPTISANDTVDDITIQSGGSITISGGELFCGSMQVNSGGTLNLTGGDINMTDSDQNINIDGVLNMSSFTSDIRTEGDLIVSASSGQLIVTDGEIEVDGDFRLESGTSVNLSGVSIVVHDDFETFSDATVVMDNVTLTADDDVKFGDDNDISITNSTFDINNRLDLGSGSTMNVSDSDLFFDESINLFSGSTLNIENTDLETDGNFAMSSGASLDMTGGSLDVGNAMTVASGASLVTDGGDVFIYDDLTFSPGSTFDMTGTDFVCQDDLTVNSGVTFNQNGGTLGVGDNLTVNSDWNHSNGAGLELIQTVHSSTVSSVVSTSLSALGMPSLTVNKSSGGNVTLQDNILVEGDFTLQAGTLNTGNYDIEVQGDLTINSSATLNNGTSEFIFSGSDSATIDFGGKSIDSITFSGSGEKCISTDLTVTNDFTVNSGASACVGNGAELDYENASTTDFVVNGTLTLEGGSTLELEDGAQVNVGSGGTLAATGTDPSNPASAATIQSENAGSGSWEISVGSGGSIDLAGAALSDGVIDVDAGASAVIIESTSFSSLPSGMGDAFIDLSGVTTGDISFSDLTFNRGNNVSVEDASPINADATTSEFVVAGYAGDMAGETFDSDPNNKILWVNNQHGLSLTGWTSTTVRVFDRVNTYLPSGAQTLNVSRFSTVTVGSASVAVSGYADVRRKFVLDDFAGTLNIHAMTFRATSADPVVIDASAVVSGGTINFYNCIFVDPDASGANALFVPGGATINLVLCTVDSDTATAGHNGSATDCIFARQAGFDTDLFADYSKNVSGNFRERNLRLRTVTGGMSSATPHGTFSEDIDGRTRSNPTTIGAAEFTASRSMLLQVTDVSSTSTTTRNAALVFNATQTYNASELVSYVTSTDGALAYLSVLDHSDLTVAGVISFAATNVGNASYQQCSDDSSLYWVLVSYDSDGDGSFDRMRKILHNSSTDSLTGSADVLLRNDSNTADVDFSSGKGWDGQIFLQPTALTGSAGLQAVFASQDNGGELHSYYFNSASTSGSFYSNAAHTGNTGQAARSYVSGSTLGIATVDLEPNPAAMTAMIGSSSVGVMAVTRYRNATLAHALVLMDRSGDGTILNGTIGPALGETFSSAPFVTFNTAGRRIAAFTGESKVHMFVPATWTLGQTLDIGLSGFGAPLGVDMTGFAFGGSVFVPFYNESEGIGAVAAIEYSSAQNANASLELLDGSYSDTRLRFDAGNGGFSDGVAYTIGSPRRLYWLPQLSSLFAITDAGWLYGWSTQFQLSSANTSAKGAPLAGLPMEFPGGRIGALAGVNLTNASLKSELGMSASGPALLVFTDSGQIYVVRAN